MAGERLESWKEIAAYLGRQVRTVQGWEKDQGLPVHRLHHHKLGSVYALRQELDAWMAARATPEADAATAALPTATTPGGDQAPSVPRAAGRRRRRVGWGIAVAAGAVALTWLGWAHRLPPAPAPAAPVALSARYFAAASAEFGHVRLLAAPDQVRYLQLSRDQRTLYAGGSQGAVAAIHLASGATTRRWTLPAPLTGLALAPDGGHLYALDGGDQLSVIDLTSGAVRDWRLEAQTAGMAVAPDGRVWVALPYNGIDALNPATGARRHVVLPPCPEALAADAAIERLFVSFQCGGPGGRSGHDALAQLDAASGAMLRSEAGPPRVGGQLALSPDGNEVWTNSDGACVGPQFDHRGCPPAPAALVEIYGAAQLRSLRTITVGDGPQRPGLGPITFLPGGERVLDGDVVLSSSRGVQLETLPPGYANAGGAVASTGGGHLYVAVRHAETAAIGVFTPTPPACLPPTLGLADWWPGDGASDDVWGMIAAHAAAAGFAPGEAGQAFDLTAPGAYLKLGPDPALDFAFHTVTVSAWVKFAGAARAPVLVKGGGWNWSRQADGRLAFCAAGGGAASCHVGSAELLPGRWYQLAVTADADGNLVQYVNGSADGTTQFRVPQSGSNGTPLWVGWDPSRHQRLDGWVDELMLYRRALAPAELRRLARLPACLAATGQ